MAVIIPKMDIPDNCYHCQLEKNFFCTAGKFYVRDQITSRTKHKKCPLRSLDAMRKEIQDYETELFNSEGLCYMSYGAVKHCLEIVDKFVAKEQTDGTRNNDS